MLDDRYDVVVIGAGPAGSRTATLTARSGLSTLLIEKRERIGYPVRCAEGIGPRRDVERFLELDEELISSPIDGFVLVSPGEKRFEGSIPGIGFVVDRELFDLRLAELAREAGAEIRTSVQATGLIKSEGEVRGVEVTDLVSGGRHSVEAAVTVGADGVESISPRWAGLKGSYLPGEVMSCAQYLVDGIDVGDNRIEFHLGSGIAPGGYAWVFPKGSGMANVGVGVSSEVSGPRRAIDCLDGFIDRRCPGACRGRFVVGGTVVARGLPSLATGGYVAAGEAANQNNPFSGGGIINALVGADLAAETIIDSIRRGDVSSDSLGRYTRAWKRSTGKANELFWHAAQSFYRLSDAEMESAVMKMRDIPGLIDDGGVNPLKMLRVLAAIRPGLIFRLVTAFLKR